MLQRLLYGIIGISAAGILYAQAPYEVRPAEPVTLPVLIDSNSAVLWVGNNLHIYNSGGDPKVTVLGTDGRTDSVSIDSNEHFPMWIESVWRSPEGTIYGWYHYERVNVCPGLNSPEIGALVSNDGGKSFRDLGIVLKSGEPDDCSAQNGYFSGGYGDFSVILDRDGQYFYFLFDSYGGDVSGQGVAIARMAATDIASPVGAVWKYHLSAWTEPGIGGKLTPVFPAASAWQRADTDAFWGPSIHWNTYLEKYVALMNRSCCEPGWPQEGIYLTIGTDLSDPKSWTKPEKILEYNDWYPWVLGLGPGETSTEAGRTVRLFVRNYSEWEIVFRREGDADLPPDPAPVVVPVDPGDPVDLPDPGNPPNPEISE